MSSYLQSYVGSDLRGQGNSPTAASHSPAIGPDQAAWSKGLEISSLLQTTLDAERVIALFSQEANGLVTHDGLHYRHPDRGLT